MKKILPLILAILFLAPLLYGQQITKSEVVRFKIKSLKINEYRDKVEKLVFFNESGDTTKIITKQYGELLNKEEFSYNKNLLTERKLFDEDEKLNQHEEYFYNSNNQIIKSKLKAFTPGGNDSMVNNYFYNVQGQLIKEEKSPLTDSSYHINSSYEYDSEGNKIKAIYLDGPELRESRFKYINKRLAEEE